MKTKHTSGPWHIGMRPGPIIYGPQGEQVALMQVPMLEAEEHAANARLIAAAPELLAALEGLMNYVGGWDETPTHPCGIARDIIAKAKG